MRKLNLLEWGLGLVSLKSVILIFSFSLILVGSSYALQASFNTNADEDTDDIAYLTQYGTWINVEPFGDVWQPSVSPDWQPFSYGHWIWTDAGWTWVSYEPYGWLVYHYGNWDYDSEIGWFWVEGSEWSPAQVQWLNYDGYCSWAPLPPAGTEWQEPWSEGGHRFWVMVKDGDFDRDNIGRYGIAKPPLPRDMNDRDAYRQPLDVHAFEKIVGHKIKVSTLNHNPVPVYMNTSRMMEHHGDRSNMMQHEQMPSEQMPMHQVKESREPANRTETRAVEKRDEEVTPREEHHSENMMMENDSRQENMRPSESHTVQLHRMILPRDEEARVMKHSPDVQRNVMVPKNNSGQPAHKEGGTKSRR